MFSWYPLSTSAPIPNRTGESQDGLGSTLVTWPCSDTRQRTREDLVTDLTLGKKEAHPTKSSVNSQPAKTSYRPNSLEKQGMCPFYRCRWLKSIVQKCLSFRALYGHGRESEWKGERTGKEQVHLRTDCRPMSRWTDHLPQPFPSTETSPFQKHWGLVR